MYQHAFDAILQFDQTVLADIVGTRLEASCPLSILAVICIALQEPIGVQVLAAGRKVSHADWHLIRSHAESFEIRQLPSRPD